MFYLHPYLGKIPILTNIFQMRWKPPTSILFKKKSNTSISPKGRHRSRHGLRHNWHLQGITSCRGVVNRSSVGSAKVLWQKWTGFIFWELYNWMPDFIGIRPFCELRTGWISGSWLPLPSTFKTYGKLTHAGEGEKPHTFPPRFGWWFGDACGYRFVFFCEIFEQESRTKLFPYVHFGEIIHLSIWWDTANCMLVLWSMA